MSFHSKIEIFRGPRKSLSSTPTGLEELCQHPSHVLLFENATKTLPIVVWHTCGGHRRQQLGAELFSCSSSSFALRAHGLLVDNVAGSVYHCTIVSTRSRPWHDARDLTSTDHGAVFGSRSSVPQTEARSRFFHICTHIVHFVDSWGSV